jgi:hypothetical protein
VIVDASIGALARGAVPAESVVPRRWSPARRRWRPVDPSAAVEVIARAGRFGLVLARVPIDDPGAACMWSASVALGLTAAAVSAADDSAAAWVVMVLAAARLGADPTALAGICRGLERAPDVTTTTLQGLRPRAIARWAGARGHGPAFDPTADPGLVGGWPCAA